MSITKHIDAVTKIPDSHMGPIIPPPRSCKIEITADCNFRCAFCVKSLQPDNSQMDRTFYSRIIRELYDAGVAEIGFFYIGESFTCKWLPEAIKEAKDLGFKRTFLTTNGSVAYPDRVRACMEAGLDSLKFSLNFDTPKQLSDIAQVSGQNWSRAIENLKAARMLRDGNHFKCRLYASSIAFDGQQGERMREVVRDIEPYVDEFYWLPLYGMSGAAKAIGWKPQPGNPGRLNAMRPPLPCWAAFTEAHITASGKLAACCFGTGSDGDLVMADLTKVSFKEGWNSLEFQALRRAHLTRDVSGTACATCAAA
jgi:pyruvate-formate lyase-activating enzyme